MQRHLLAVEELGKLDRSRLNPWGVVTAALATVVAHGAMAVTAFIAMHQLVCLIIMGADIFGDVPLDELAHAHAAAGNPWGLWAVR